MSFCVEPVDENHRISIETPNVHKPTRIRNGQLCKDLSTPKPMNATDTGCPVDPSFEDDWKAARIGPV